MSDFLKNGNLLSVLTAAVTAALAAAWSAELAYGAAGWQVRLVLVATSLLVCGASLGLWIRRSAARAATVRRYIGDLCQVDQRGFDQHVPAPTEISHKSPWYTTLSELQELLGSCQEKQVEAEQAQVRLKVRVRRLETEHQQMKEILSGLTDPVLAVNHYDELVLANDSARTLLQIDESATEERALAHLVKCQQLIDVITEVRQRKTATQRLQEIELPDETGQRLCYNATVRTVPLSTQGSEPLQVAEQGAVVVLRDISSHKAIQKRNAEFVSAVSHEMKTPLSGIKAYVELLADGDAEDEETQEEFLTVINTQADRLQRLIDNMLNLARIEAGVVNVNKQSCSLNEILEEAQNVVIPAGEKKKIELASDLSQMYLGVLADRDMILQVAINLLSNAIKYTDAGGTVTIRSRMKDKDVQFEVEDSGVGLNSEDCEKVFDKFYRVKKDSQMAQGTGLGLPLAKHIVEDVHGGTLEVISSPGKGSTFVATLPAVGILR